VGTVLHGALAAEEVERRAAAAGRRPTVRLRGEGRHLAFRDRFLGEVDPLPPPLGIDDFVIRRADGVAAYQLAVVVDDAAMGITEVVRGDDLLASTPRQLLLYEALGARPPDFVHVPLVLSPGGERLAKRTRPPSIADLRAAGVSGEAVVGALAASAGLLPLARDIHPSALLPGFELGKVSLGAVVLDGAQQRTV
jgi:glutamyl-tRNA synthetase